MAVGLTPTQHLAAVTSSAFYSLWNLVAGFIIPKAVSKLYIPRGLIKLHRVITFYSYRFYKLTVELKIYIIHIISINFYKIPKSFDV